MNINIYTKDEYVFSNFMSIQNVLLCFGGVLKVTAGRVTPMCLECCRMNVLKNIWVHRI